MPQSGKPESLRVGPGEMRCRPYMRSDGVYVHSPKCETALERGWATDQTADADWRENFGDGKSMPWPKALGIALAITAATLAVIVTVYYFRVMG